MSKGPGHVERALAKVFADPYGIFTVSELCVLVWPDLRPENVTQAHRVSVRRAAGKLAEATGWNWWRYLCAIGSHEKV